MVLDHLHDLSLQLCFYFGNAAPFESRRVEQAFLRFVILTGQIGNSIFDKFAYLHHISIAFSLAGIILIPLNPWAFPIKVYNFIIFIILKWEFGSILEGEGPFVVFDLTFSCELGILNFH